MSENECALITKMDPCSSQCIACLLLSFTKVVDDIIIGNQID